MLVALGTLICLMATTRAFRGLRYSESAGSLKNLVAPPYDVISPQQREELASRSPYNVVHLTLPESREDDRSKFVKYARSAAAIADWRRTGILGLEARPALYRYTQRFTVPGSSHVFERTKIMALLKVEPYENGVVLPHEQTFPKHKEDRLRILEATRAHLECIYGLFEDPGRVVHDLITSAPGAISVSVEDDGVENRLEVVDSPDAIQAITGALADKKVWIADGHHRYETAVHFRSLQGQKDGLVPEDFMMMALSSMSDPGLVILPTHRIVSHMPVTKGELETLLRTKFNLRQMPNGQLLEDISKCDQKETRALGIALPGGMGFVCYLDRPEDVLKWIPGEQSDRLKMLDVSILHSIIFENMLGLTGNDFFSYTRDPQEALQSVKDGNGAAFLMNPPTVDDMRAIALGREKMPQKSTYYYPKLLSGLVIWCLSDFES